jgi:hypothetical protein
MLPSHPVYRSLTRLYPREFRLHYGSDLVQHHADLVSDRGAVAAWTRTGVDLIVTVPRYRLERIMSDQNSVTTINVAITLLATAGVVSLLTGVYPGLVLLLAALVLAIAQRGTLARAIRTPDSNRRRRRLTTAAVLGVVFAASYGTYLLVIGDTWTLRETVLAAIGTPAMFGAVVYLIAGLLTPRSSAPAAQPITPAA